jgi:hypothetical protein
LAGALEADELTDKDYAVKKLLAIVEWIEANDVNISPSDN